MPKHIQDILYPYFTSQESLEEQAFRLLQNSLNLPLNELYALMEFILRK